MDLNKINTIDYEGTKLFLLEKDDCFAVTDWFLEKDKTMQFCLWDRENDDKWVDNFSSFSVEAGYKEYDIFIDFIKTFKVPYSTWVDSDNVYAKETACAILGINAQNIPEKEE